MKTTDKSAFFCTLADVHDLYGATCSTQAAELWFSTLQCYELEKIQAAFKSHMRHPHFGRFAPKPADLMREMETETMPDWMVGAL